MNDGIVSKHLNVDDDFNGIEDKDGNGGVGDKKFKVLSRGILTIRLMMIMMTGLVKIVLMTK